MKPGAAALACLFLAATLFAEEPPAAPLSESREQLKSLRKDQSARKTGETTSSLRDALPGLSVPTPGPASEPLPSMSREAEAEESTSRNWLLQRYDSLDPKRKAAMHPRDRADDPESAGEQLDPDDPEYFLKLYERQRRDAADKEMERSGGGERTKPNSSVNPFTPFMKDWLAGSPVGDVVRESLEMNSRRNAVDGSQGSLGFTAGETTLRVDAPAALSGAGQVVATAAQATASNPYLQALTLPSPGEREVAPPTVPAFVPPPPRERETVAPVAPRSTPQEDLRRALPAGADDAKKYFPQLKKF